MTSGSGDGRHIQKDSEYLPPIVGGAREVTENYYTNKNTTYSACLEKYLLIKVS